MEGFKKLLIVASVFVILAIIVGGGVWFYKSKRYALIAMGRSPTGRRTKTRSMVLSLGILILGNKEILTRNESSSGTRPQTKGF